MEGPDSGESIVRTHYDGKRRPRYESLIMKETARNDDLRKAVKLSDIIQWIMEEVIKEPYDIVRANCQHFGRECWHQLVLHKPYPDPARQDRQFCEQTWFLVCSGECSVILVECGCAQVFFKDDIEGMAWPCLTPSIHDA